MPKASLTARSGLLACTTISSGSMVSTSRSIMRYSVIWADTQIQELGHSYGGSQVFRVHGFRYIGAVLQGGGKGFPHKTRCNDERDFSIFEQGNQALTTLAAEFDIQYGEREVLGEYRPLG